MRSFALASFAIVSCLGVMSFSIGAQAQGDKRQSTKNYHRLVGASVAEVERALGKSSDVQQINNGRTSYSWDGPKGSINAWWVKGKMDAIEFSAVDSWRTTLEMYGFGTTGVKAKTVTGDNGDYQKLLGIKGIPARWTCELNSGNLIFERH